MLDNYFIFSASSGQPRGLEQSEEMVTVPFTPWGPHAFPLHACGFLALQKQ